VDPRERLRLALLGTGCARCGQAYPAQGIRVLAQREGIAFVQLVCFACQIQTLALVTGGPGSDEDGVEAPPEAETPPISELDVLEMHSFLEGYEGDVQGLFEAGRDGRPDGPE
jgi:hypothetical protein